MDYDYWDDKLKRVIIHDKKYLIKEGDDVPMIMGIEIEIFCLQLSDFGIEELWRWVTFLHEHADLI